MSSQAKYATNDSYSSYPRPSSPQHALVYQPSLGYAALAPSPVFGAGRYAESSPYGTTNHNYNSNSNFNSHAGNRGAVGDGTTSRLMHSDGVDYSRRPASASGFARNGEQNNNNAYYNNGSSVGLAAAGYQTPPTLQDWFRSVDTNNSGAIDAYELVNALRKGKINISLEGAAKLIALFDTRGARQVDFEQFRAMHPFIDSMTKGFKKRDLNGDGYLQLNEVRAALVDSGHYVSEVCLQTIMEKFENSSGGGGGQNFNNSVRGVLSFEDYVALSIFITSVKNTFASYDIRNSGQVAMGFSDFLSACIVVK